MSKCDIKKMPGYVDASKIKNKGLEMKVEQLLTKYDVVTYHGTDSAEIEGGSFDVTRRSKNSSMLPQGLYSTPSQLEGAGFGSSVYKLGVRKGKVYNFTNPKENERSSAMVSAYREALHNSGYTGEWAEGLVGDFVDTGFMKPGISAEDKTKVLLAGGYDTVMDGSRHLISLNPNRDVKILGRQDSESIKERSDARKRKKFWHNKNK